METTVAGQRARQLPTGTLTFLFTDIQGSTTKVAELGIERWTDVLRAHARILREAIAAGGGIGVRTEGDAFFVVFPRAQGAIEACVHAQRALFAEPWPHGAEVRVRMGLHTGQAALGGPDTGMDYVGLDVHRAARVAAAGHGGQVLLSGAVAALIQGTLPENVIIRDLGDHQLKDIARPERLHQLVIDGLPREFPPLRTLE
ncbi:MAG: adenylate/guanylate cyclase domain-containing protein, partial [Dehalococcoidia bacterium]